MTQILHLVSSTSRPGIAPALVSLAKYLDQLGEYDHRIASIEPIPAPEREQFGEAGFGILSAGTETEISRQIGEAEIVQVEWWGHPSLLRLLQGNLPAARFSVWIHSLSPSGIPWDLSEMADCLIVPRSPAAPRTAEKVFPEEVLLQKTWKISPGADFSLVEGAYPSPHEGFRVGCFDPLFGGVLHPEFVRAVELFQTKQLQCFVFGGEIPQQLRDEVIERNTENSFLFRGIPGDLRSEIEQLDLLLYPAHPETDDLCGYHLQLSMYAGVPVVAFPFGAARTFVIDGFTGRTAGSAEEFAAAVDELAHSSEERSRLGENSVQYVRQLYGARNAAVAFHGIYQELLQQEKRKKHWGISRVLPLLNQPLPLRDLVPEARRDSGAALFVASLESPALAASCTDSLLLRDTEQLMLAEAPLLSVWPRNALETLFWHIDQYPDDAHLKLWGGLALVGSIDWERAFNLFQEALGSDTKLFRAHWYSALAAKQLGKVELAEREEAKFQEKHPAFGLAGQYRARFGGV